MFVGVGVGGEGRARRAATAEAVRDFAGGAVHVVHVGGGCEAH